MNNSKIRETIEMLNWVRKDATGGTVDENKRTNLPAILAPHIAAVSALEIPARLAQRQRDDKRMSTTNDLNQNATPPVNSEAVHFGEWVCELGAAITTAGKAYRDAVGRKDPEDIECALVAENALRRLRISARCRSHTDQTDRTDTAGGAS